MRSFVQMIDDNTAKITSYKLSRTRGILKRVHTEKLNVINPEKEQAELESMNDGFGDVYCAYTTPIHSDNYQMTIPIYYRLLLYALKLKIYSPFSDKAKLVIFTDYTVIHVFDLSDNGTAFDAGEYELIFHTIADTHTPETVTNAVIDNDNMLVNIYGASPITFDGDEFTYYSVIDPSVSGGQPKVVPKLVNVNPIENENGVLLPDAIYFKIVGNTEESAFGSIETIIYPMIEEPTGT